MEQVLLQATTDKGYVFYMDKRAGKPVFTLSAHDEAVTGILIYIVNIKLICWEGL